MRPDHAPARLLDRLANAAILAVLLILLTFVLPRALPGDPLSAMAPAGRDLGEADRAALAVFYGLDRPLGEQLFGHVTGLLSGDMGTSIRLQRPVTELILERAPATALLVVSGLGLGTVIGTGCGSIAGWYAGRRRDLGIVVAMSALRSVPVFFVAAVLHHLLAVRLRLFPAYGAVSGFGSTNLADTAYHLVLPALSLAISIAAAQVLVMRAAVRAQRAEPFAAAALARGIPVARVRRVHVARPAWRAMVGIVGVQAGVAMSSTILVESVYAYPGLGSLMADAVVARDVPVLQGCLVVATLCAIGCGLVAEIVRDRLDPRTEEAR